MAARTAFPILLLLAGCTAASTHSVPRPTYEVGPGMTYGTAYAAPAPRRTYGTRASDVALTVVSAPFVLAFRVAVCAASAVVAGPTAAVFAVSDDPRGGFDYLRDGLAYNCGPPYVVPVPAAGRYDREAPGPPRPLIPDADAAAPPPATSSEPGTELGPPQAVTRPGSSVVVASP
jgi:hypothetical protein